MLVFISYSHEDSTLVGRLTEKLSASGIETFQDTKDVAWGGRITTDVQRALERAAGVVVVVSPASVASQWVPYEIGYATALRKPILPFLTHRSIQLPGYLADIRHFSDLDQVGAFIDRVKSIGQTGVVGERNEVSKAALAAKMIGEIQPQMPALLTEMQDDIQHDTTGLVREFLVMSEERVVFSDPKPRFRYYENEHPNLQLQVDRLEEMHLVAEISSRPFPIYRMTSAFVAALLGTSHAG